MVKRLSAIHHGQLRRNSWGPIHLERTGLLSSFLFSWVNFFLVWKPQCEIVVPHLELAHFAFCQSRSHV